MNASQARSRIADPSTTSTSGGRRLAVAMEEYLRRVGEGDPPDRSSFLGRYPEIAGDLAECLEGLEAILSARGQFAATGPAPGEAGTFAPIPPTRLGDFRIREEVGRGGMGVVYEAEQVPLGRRVALKVLPASAALDPRQLQRFQLEAQAAALLSHEHIVPVYAVGCDRGIPFYAMQFIEGRSLADLVRTLGAPAKPGARPPGRGHARRVARLGIQAAEALEHAHAVGVIHRDIKPSNLLIDDRDHLWVADFGLARVGPEDPGLTHTGDLVGTLRYMTPEQARGDRVAADPRTDVYALGVTLYELATLRPAFSAPDRSELLRRIVHDEPPAPRQLAPDLPRDLETIILKAMAKEPAGRYPSARALADDLTRFLEDKPILARRPGPVDRLAKWARRHRTLLATAAGILAVAFSALVALLVRDLQRSKASRAFDRLAFEHASETIQQITNELRGFEPCPLTMPLFKDVLRPAIEYYDRIVHDPSKTYIDPEFRARALRQASSLRAKLGDPQAQAGFDHAIQLYERLVVERPTHLWLRLGLIQTLQESASLRVSLGDAGRAGTLTRRALEVAEGLLAAEGVGATCDVRELAQAFNNLAWGLVTQPFERPSDAALAVALARKVTHWASSPKVPHEAPTPPPLIAGYWNTLGMALCRIGEDAEAEAALGKSIALSNGTSAEDWFALALIHARRGDREAARRHHDRAMAALKARRAPADPGLAALQRESNQALSAPPPADSAPSPLPRLRGHRGTVITRPTLPD